MPDFTMCPSLSCKRKESCKRNEASGTVSSEYSQSWFVEPPERDGYCDYYWQPIENDCKQQKGMSGMPQKINCDRVIWLQDILERYRAACRIATVAASYADEAAKLAAIHEIVELFNLQWEDESAMRNAAYKFFPIQKDFTNKAESPNEQD